MDKQPMLDDLQHFVRALRSDNGRLLVSRRVNGFALGFSREPLVVGNLFCPKCGDLRRVKIEPVSLPSAVDETVRNHQPKLIVSGVPASPGEEQQQAEIIRLLAPSLFELKCVQCEMLSTAVIYQGVDGPSLAVLPSEYGGIRTPHTPDGIAFYLDQAQRARSVGASSAAVAMYRGALESLLFEQGFRSGMLGQKLADLDRQIAERTSPKWANELEPEYLKILKDLGNGSIHPNDGDITSQASLDNNLLNVLAELFMHLLFTVYEVPFKRDERLASLRKSAALFRK